MTKHFSPTGRRQWIHTGALACALCLYSAAGFALEPPTLDITAQSNATGLSRERPLAPGMVLQTGDGVRVEVSTSARAFVYVIAVGASGSAVLLHPFSRVSSQALLQAGQRLTVPESPAFLPLDRHVGRETIVALASRTPVRDIDGMLLTLEEALAQGGAVPASVLRDFGEARLTAFDHVAPLDGVAPTAPVTRSGRLFKGDEEASGVLSSSGSRIDALLGGSTPPALARPAQAVPALPSPAANSSRGRPAPSRPDPIPAESERSDPVPSDDAGSDAQPPDAGSFFGGVASLFGAGIELSAGAEGTPDSASRIVEPLPPTADAMDTTAKAGAQAVVARSVQTEEITVPAPVRSVRGRDLSAGAVSPTTTVLGPPSGDSAATTPVRAAAAPVRGPAAGTASADPVPAAAAGPAAADPGTGASEADDDGGGGLLDGWSSLFSSPPVAAAQTRGRLASAEPANVPPQGVLPSAEASSDGTAGVTTFAVPDHVRGEHATPSEPVPTFAASPASNPDAGAADTGPPSIDRAPLLRPPGAARGAAPEHASVLDGAGSLVAALFGVVPASAPVATQADPSAVLDDTDPDTRTSGGATPAAGTPGQDAAPTQTSASTIVAPSSPPGPSANTAMPVARAGSSPLSQPAAVASARLPATSLPTASASAQRQRPQVQPRTVSVPASGVSGPAAPVGASTFETLLGLFAPQSPATIGLGGAGDAGGLPDAVVLNDDGGVVEDEAPEPILQSNAKPEPSRPAAAEPQAPIRTAAADATASRGSLRARIGALFGFGVAAPSGPEVTADASALSATGTAVSKGPPGQGTSGIGEVTPRAASIAAVPPPLEIRDPAAPVLLPRIGVAPAATQRRQSDSVLSGAGSRIARLLGESEDADAQLEPVQASVAERRAPTAVGLTERPDAPLALTVVSPTTTAPTTAAAQATTAAQETTTALASDTARAATDAEPTTADSPALRPAAEAQTVTAAIAAPPAVSVMPTQPDLAPLALTPVQARLELDPAADGALSRAVVLVVSPKTIGSGIVVDAHGHILTNWHVVNGFRRVTVWLKADGQVSVDRGAPRVARVVRSSRSSDLALLQLDGAPPAIEPVPLAATALAERGSLLHLVGHFGGDQWNHTMGRYVATKARHSWLTAGRFVHRETMVRARVEGSPGASGGMLLNDRLELIGINTHVAKRTGQVYAVAVDSIRRFLAGGSEAELGSQSADRRSVVAPSTAVRAVTENN